MLLNLQDYISVWLSPEKIAALEYTVTKIEFEAEITNNT